MVFSCGSAFDIDGGYHGNLTLHACTDRDNDVCYIWGEVGDGDDRDGKIGSVCQVSSNFNPIYHAIVFPSDSAFGIDDGYQDNITPHTCTDGDGNANDKDGKRESVHQMMDSKVTSLFTPGLTVIMILVNFGGGGDNDDVKDGKQEPVCQVNSEVNCTHHDMVFPCVHLLEGDDVYQGNITPHCSTDGAISIL
eukprot:5399699-Ditylum_brightwellii.AAC.1